MKEWTRPPKSDTFTDIKVPQASLGIRQKIRDRVMAKVRYIGLDIAKDVFKYSWLTKLKHAGRLTIGHEP